uniref:response regulator transcription factor n=1 Tax=Herbidospora sakaeratensis TaxID=564415 RepID=UPI000785462D|nr:response regulator transcription factor [Herbidospora sakaeratensis]
MFIRIAVFDPLPLYRHGIIAILREAGLSSEAPEEVFAWMDNDHFPLVVLSLQASDDWELLERLCRTRSNLLVIALLPDDAIATHVRALASGAVATLPREAEPSAVRATVEAVISGRTVLPIGVLRGLTSHDAATTPEPALLSPRELEWLRHLSTGATVADLAERAGYSERMMFRLLRDLYKRMRAGNRTEALLLAREHGWI